MAIKKTDLYRSLWESCDVLRGSMDASQYKDYILTLLFVKYVSDKYDALGDEAMIEVPEGASFSDLIKFKGKPNIGEETQKLITRIAEENDLQGTINNANFNDPDKLGKNKDMVDRLTKLIGIFEGLALGGNQASDDDLLGDAYEYLMRHFAVDSGKSKGQFYTPSEVSRVLAKIIGIPKDAPSDTSVYDPTCGSGSLLLKLDSQADNTLSLFGQENDNATTALAKMNMILHDNEDAEIVQGNTLADPHFLANETTLKTFDFIVANPPFSHKEWTNGVDLNNDLFKRFEYGMPPHKNGDYAFLLHILKSMKSTAKAAVILPHGVLFRGNAEAEIRTKLINQGYIKAIIGLPANLFYGTGIPACIIFMDKEDAHARKGIFMVDASKGFMKDGNKNRLREQDIHKIVDVFTKQSKLTGFSRMVDLDEIAGHGFNLNIPRYIDGSAAEDLHDLDAHLNGGLPQHDISELQNYWDHFPHLHATLFKADDKREGYFHLQTEPAQLKATIMADAQYQAFEKEVMVRFQTWREKHIDALKNLSKDKQIQPKQVIHDLSEDLLSGFESAPLLNAYDVYQILMDYWAEALQDDVYMLAQEGWSNDYLVRLVRTDTKGKDTEKADLVIGAGKKAKKYKMDFIPLSIMIEAYFKKEQAALDALLLQQDEAGQALSSYLEEHAVEDGLLELAINDTEKVTKVSASQRLKLIKGNTADKDEAAALTAVIKLFTADANAKKTYKEAKAKFDLKLLAQYGKLEELDVKLLLVDKKWMATLEQRIQGEVERITQQLAQRLTQLNQRYAIPLPELEEQARIVSECMDGHLEAMGLLWEKVQHNE